MKTIYIVIELVYDDWGSPMTDLEESIDSVWSTEESAKKRIKELQKQYKEEDMEEEDICFSIVERIIQD